MNLRAQLVLSQLPFWLLLVLSFGLLSRTLDARVQATTQAAQVQDEIAQAAQILQHVVDMETSLRGYVIAGQQVFLGPFYSARAALPGELTTLTAQVQAQPEGAGRTEALAHLARIEAETLRWQSQVAESEIAKRAYSAEAAEAQVRTGNGKRILDGIRAEVAAFRAGEQARLTAATVLANERLGHLRLTLYGGAALTLLASLLATLGGAQVLARRLARLTDAARRLNTGEESVQVAERGPQELRTLAGAFNAMGGRLAAARQDADSRAEALAGANGWMRQLSELSDTLQAARTLDEAARVLDTALPKLLPGTRGSLLHHNASRNLLIPLAAWNEHGGGQAAAPANPDGCWSLRLGQARVNDGHSFAPPCLHGPSEHGGAATYLCVPLFSHGETLGLLRLSAADAGNGEQGAPIPDALRVRTGDVVRQVELALASLRLQDRLLQQSIRDPLTGLFNRRRLEDQLAGSFAQAAAGGAPLSLLALDVDHFKRLNDSFGHEAGDMVLVRLGALLRDLTPDGGTPARPGGEEFTVLLPGHDLYAARTLAETIRERVAAWTLSHSGVTLGQITVSIGVATLTAHHATPDSLVRSADDALYSAKRGGRNRVMNALSDVLVGLPAAN